MFTLKHGQSAQIFSKIIRTIFIISMLFYVFGASHQVLAVENTGARLREIDNKLKEIETSQNQMLADQNAMLEKIKILKIWSRRKGGGRVS